MPVNPLGDSATANTNQTEYDPFASVVIPGNVSAIDDAGAYGYDAPQKPDFVKADDDNFLGA
jgi:hypothetical protein